MLYYQLISWGVTVPLDVESVKELKQKFKLARNKELNFALALGKKPEDCALIMHKERGGDKLLLQVKKTDGVQPQKSCHGTLTVDGQLVKLACRSDPPAGLVKNFRIFFRSTGMAMKLAVLAPGETEFALDREDAEAAAEEAAPGAPAVSAVAPPLSEVETAALQARMDAVQEALGGLQGPVQGKIAEGHQRAQMLLEDGSKQAGSKLAGSKLAKLLDQLEAALKQIAKIAVQQAAAPVTDPVADPAEARWQQGAAKLEPHLRRVLAAGHGDLAGLQALWAEAQGRAAAGDFAGALKVLGQLAAPLAQAVQPAQGAQEVNLAAGEDKSQLQAAWDSVATGYDPLVAALERQQDPRATKLRAAWDMALQAGRAGDFDKANMIAARLRPVLEAAPAETPAPPPPGPDMASGNSGPGHSGSGKDAPAPAPDPAPEERPEAGPEAEPAAAPPPPAEREQAPDPTAGAAADPVAEPAKKTAAPNLAAPLADSTDDPAKKQALQNIDKARGSLLQLEGLIAAFGTPHPELWDRVVAQADGLLSPAEAAEVGDIDKAAKQADALLAKLEPAVKQLTLDKQTWEQQHPLFAARLQPIKAHALKGVDPVKSRLQALEDEITVAEADAARFEFKKAASGIVSFLTRGDALEALADDFAHYRAIQQVRATRVLPVRGKVSPRAPVQAAIDAVLAAYDDGVNEAGKEDFEAAVRLMNQVPALHDKMELMQDSAK